MRFAKDIVSIDETSAKISEKLEQRKYLEDRRPIISRIKITRMICNFSDFDINNYNQYY